MGDGQDGQGFRLGGLDDGMNRKRRKPRLGGTACIDGRTCIATYSYEGQRYCATHLADRLFAASVRYAGRCWAEGYHRVACNGGLQCAHIFSRRYRALRWSHDNAVALCAGHHTFFTHSPAAWEQWCRDMGVPWDELR